LFQVRSDVLLLTNPRILRQAPVLFLAATLSWVVSLATIHFPGDLTVQSGLYSSLTCANISKMKRERAPVTEHYVASNVSLADVDS
jgi:hypothetical protein